MTRSTRFRWHDPFRKTKGRIPRPWQDPRKYNSKNRWPLMARQSLILHLYNVGLTTSEVAELMQITVATLHKHLDRIYYKFNVHNRSDAIKKCLEMDCKPKTEDYKLKTEALET
jgi:DNA-binding NarL/FixJ family response regulator